MTALHQFSYQLDLSPQPLFSQPTGITTQSVSELVVEIVQALQVQELNSGSLGIAPHELVSDCSIELSVSAQSLPSIGLPHRGKSWLPNYMMLAFMMNGQPVR